MTVNELDPWETPLVQQYADGRLRARVLQAKAELLANDPEEYNARSDAGMAVYREEEIRRARQNLAAEIAAGSRKYALERREARRLRWQAVLHSMRDSLLKISEGLAARR